MKRITLSYIASNAGVSISTVSRVLSGRAIECRIPQKTSEKVLIEARRAGYTPSMVVQSVQNVKNNMIGLMLPSVSNPFFAEMAGYLIAFLRKEGYSAILMDNNDNSNIFKEDVANLVAKGVDGIIAVPSTVSDNEAFLLESIDRNYCPVVLVDRAYKDTILPFVCTNNYQGGLIATRKLLEAGHKRVACIQGAVASMPNIERVRGYRAGMEEAGLDSNVIVVGKEFSIRNGYSETKRILKLRNRPTAIFALGNTIAIGAMEAINEAGLKVGQDISLISFDRNAFLGHIGPSMASIGQPVEDMAKISVDILMKKISGVTVKSSHILLTPTFIDGDTIKDIFC